MNVFWVILFWVCIIVGFLSGVALGSGRMKTFRISLVMFGIAAAEMTLKLLGFYR